MVRYLTLFYILIVFLLGSCTPESESELRKSLAVALKEKKISKEKMANILKEYDMLRKEDKDKAQEYALKIVNAIEMGGDSSHIDVVRRQVTGEVEKV